MTQRKVFWLVNTTLSGLRYRVLDRNKDTMRATIVGDTGVPFEVSVKPDDLEKLAYTVEITMEDVPDAPVHGECQTA